MNILIIHETEYRNKVVYEYQIIPEILSSAGNNVYVIDYPSNWTRKGPFDFGSLKTQIIKNVRKAQKKRGILLIRPGFVKIPIISRISAFITHFFAIRYAIKKYKIEKIILYSAPTNGLQTIFWSKVYKIPVLFRLLDVLHRLVPNNILVAPTYLIEKIIYKHSNKILAITPRLAEYAKKMSGREENIDYLPSGSDADLFYPKPKDPKLMKKIGLSKNDLVLLFSGTLYNFSGLDELINLFPNYLKKYPNLKLLIAGRGEQEQFLRKLVKQSNLEESVKFCGFVQYENLSEYINLADIGINLFKINNVTNIIFPGKIYQYLACGKPVIATKLQGMLDIFPTNTHKHHIYYMKSQSDFISLLEKIYIKYSKSKFADNNPSLQEISNIISAKLLKLKN